jgi:hypothetical protein
VAELSDELRSAQDELQAATETIRELKSLAEGRSRVDAACSPMPVQHWPRALGASASAPESVEVEALTRMGDSRMLLQNLEEQLRALNLENESLTTSRCDPDCSMA